MAPPSREAVTGPYYRKLLGRIRLKHRLNLGDYLISELDQVALLTTVFFISVVLSLTVIGFAVFGFVTVGFAVIGLAVVYVALVRVSGGSSAYGGGGAVRSGRSDGGSDAARGSVLSGGVLTVAGARLGFVRLAG